MADSSVSFLLDKLTWLLQEEVNLQRGIREDVQYIKDELERHKAILMLADSLEDKDPELKVWVKRVRDIAQDMEDAIDEYYLRLVDHQQGKIRSTFHKILFGIKTMKGRHKIASNIQRIKSKVEVISHRRPIIPSSSSQRLSSRLDSQGNVGIYLIVIYLHYKTYAITIIILYDISQISIEHMHINNLGIYDMLI